MQIMRINVQIILTSIGWGKRYKYSYCTLLDQVRATYPYLLRRPYLNELTSLRIMGIPKIRPIIPCEMSLYSC